jgi:hypothetical protein
MDEYGDFCAMNKLVSCLLVFALAILWGCENNASKQHEGNEYYYYPSKNIYYDVSNHRYLFSLDSGKTWDSIHSETPEPAIDGKKEVIYSTSTEVWQNNDLHLETYKGTMLNIINEQSLKQPEPAVSKKSLAKTSDEANNQGDKKERKRPIKRFFQKIFGKKKD